MVVAGVCFPRESDPMSEGSLEWLRGRGTSLQVDIEGVGFLDVPSSLRLETDRGCPQGPYVFTPYTTAQYTVVFDLCLARQGLTL